MGPRVITEMWYKSSHRLPTSQKCARSLIKEQEGRSARLCFSFLISSCSHLLSIPMLPSWLIETGVPRGPPSSYVFCSSILFSKFRLSSPTESITILLSQKSDSVHIKYVDLAFKVSCSPFPSNWSHSHTWHAHSCLSAILLEHLTTLPSRAWIFLSFLLPARKSTVTTLAFPSWRSFHWTPPMLYQTILQVMMYFSIF